MGSNEVKLDHQLTYELWLNSAFWEAAPSWLQYREKAEELAAEAFELRSSILIRKDPLYNEWSNDIALRSLNKPEEVQEIVNYIKAKRQNRKEKIVLPATQQRPKIALSHED